MAKNAPTIVVKKVVKAAGHHGGAWKVAYADFVTAMMAFFLLLWLLNVTTDEQKTGIADYFAPQTASRLESGSGGILGGTALSAVGARTSERSAPKVIVEMSPPRQRKPTTEETEGGGEGREQALSDEELEKKLAEKEQKAFEQAEQMLRQAIQETPEIADLAKNLIVDNTPEGLRIQLVDQERQSMFPAGSAEMLPGAKALLAKISQVVAKLPNRISITGHTDSTPFRSGANGYGNWELSADRANASRRGLVENGLEPQRVAYVTGKADREPLIAEDPALPSNRRISIVLLREARAGAGEGAEPDSPPPGAPAPVRALDDKG
jgi:chemotaxis protein MotB